MGSANELTDLFGEPIDSTYTKETRRLALFYPLATYISVERRMDELRMKHKLRTNSEVLLMLLGLEWEEDQ